MDGISLTISKAKPNDTGRGIARLDPSTMLALSISPGDIVQIEGKHATLAKVWRADRQDWGQEQIRIDGYVRQNADASIGDRVNVSKPTVNDAERVVLAPTEKMPQLKLKGEMIAVLKHQLNGTPLIQGDIVPVEMTHPMSPIAGNTLSGGFTPFRAVEVTPAGAVIIGKHTVLEFQSKPVSGFEEVMATGTTYEDIGGLHKEVSRVREMIEMPLKHPELFARLGIQPPKGVLMYGPPGTGKTLIAKAVASESKVSFFHIAGPEIISKYYGESEQKLREIFEEASKNSPAIIFIDELDSIAPKRENVTGEVERRIVAQLLAMMDGIEDRGQVIVIAATNRVDAIDAALRRPGRFDREIEIGVPDQKDRLEIFQIHTRSMPIYNWETDIAANILLERITSFENHSKIRISENASKIISLESEKNILRHELTTINDELEKLEIEKINTENPVLHINPVLHKILNAITNKHNQVIELESQSKEIKREIELNEMSTQKIETDIEKINQIYPIVAGKKSLLQSIVVDINEAKHLKNIRGFDDIRNVFLDNTLNQIDEQVREIEETFFDSGVISEDYIKKVVENSIPPLLNQLASTTHGFVGADIAALCREAAMKALKRQMPLIKANMKIKKSDEESEPGEITAGEFEAYDSKIPQTILDSIDVTHDDFAAALKEIEPSSMREVFVDVPNIKWSDVGGLSSLRRDLIEAVEWPLKQPEKFIQMGIRPPKGVLMYGPPGTGKTLVAKAVANETNANFISVRGPELLSKWLGDSEKAIHEIFRKARLVAPAIIFFDEIDAIAPARGSYPGSGALDRVVNQLLTELDGLEILKDVVVIAATNIPDAIDPALLRAGRFDRFVYAGIPTRDERREIFAVHTKNMPLDSDVVLDQFVDLTEGYVGSGIENLCWEAAMRAMRESGDGDEIVKVSKKHFESALKETKPLISENVTQFNQKMRDKFKGNIPTRQSSYIG